MVFPGSLQAPFLWLAEESVACARAFATADTP